MTFKIVYSFGVGMYGVADSDHATREEAAEAGKKIGSTFVAVFPAWKVHRVLEVLNKGTTAFDEVRVFEKVVEAHAVAADTADFYARVTEILKMVGKVVES